ncbi:MAG: acyl carrier protein [Anaerovoracaceae bacterium]|nr:acyl carrier protein [Anaerovoracaceae bacterium]
MTFEELKEIMIDTLGCDEEKITEEASLAEDLNIDSLDAVELVMAIEEKIGVKIPDEDLANLLTVSDIIDAVKKHQA